MSTRRPVPCSWHRLFGFDGADPCHTPTNTTTPASVAIPYTVESPPQKTPRPGAGREEEAQEIGPRASQPQPTPKSGEAKLPPPTHPPCGGDPDIRRPGIPSRSSTNSTNELREMRHPARAVSLPRNAATGEKAASKAEENVNKPKAFERVWSEADEIRILPPARAKLHGVVAGRLLDKTEFTVTEIYEKVRRLRTRYNKLRATATGAQLSGGDRDKYELSKKIWGNLLLPKRANKEEGSSDEVAHVCRGFEELRRLYPHLAVVVERISATGHGCLLKRAFELVDDGKARELDAKVKKQRVLEVKTELNRDSVQREVLSSLIRYVD